VPRASPFFRPALIFTALLLASSFALRVLPLAAESAHSVPPPALDTPANPQAAQFMTPQQVKSLHLDDVDNYQRHIYFWQDVPRRAKYVEIWNEVKAAQ